MRRTVTTVFIGLSISGCATTDLEEPRTLGERNAGYNYIPLDPLPVSAASLGRCVARSDKPNVVADFMDALPDNAVRIAIQDVSAAGQGALGPISLGTSGRQYRVTLDYVTADTTNIAFVLSTTDGSDPITAMTERREGTVILRRASGVTPDNAREVVIPVYVGVGLRLTAFVDVRRGNVNLASLGALAASAEANRTAGTLAVQTLGISGQQVASQLPLPSELNATTVQNAIQSLGAVKAILFDRDTAIAPRVTGIYNPLPSSDPRIVNQIVTGLAEDSVPWTPCGTRPLQAPQVEP